MTIRIATPRGMRQIGPGHPTFIVAEMSGNHNGDFDRARRLIDAAADAGADAVKLQTYTADTLTIDSDQEWFRVKVNDAWAGQTLYQLYQSASTPWEWQPKLKQHAESRGLTLFSTPFDETAVDFLERMEVALYKVASFEACDLALLRAVGRTRKPVIVSRGLCSAEELSLTLSTLRESGCPDVAVLHCVSAYPAAPEDMNLATIRDLATRFGVVSGLSDHTLGTAVAVAGVALGASVIEKHFTLARADGGPDAAFSLEADELAALVRDVRTAEKAIGRPTYQAGARERENIVFRRSLFVVRDVRRGEVFSADNVRVIRPGYGLAPLHLPQVLGKRAATDVKRGTPLSRDLVEGM